MLITTNFLVPDFDKNISNKINEDVEVKSQHVLSIANGEDYHSAIATSGFCSKTDGVYVFATKIDQIRDVCLFIGFTDVATYDSKKNGYLGKHLSGTSFSCYDGKRCPGDRYLSKKITRQATEIICILTISNNGCKKEIQWIVDGNEGPIHDCTTDFGNGDEIFPCITFAEDEQQVEFIPFDQAKFRSPKIDDLIKEYSKPTIQITTSAPSTSTAENDAFISHLRDQVGRSQEHLLQQSEKRIQQVEQLMQQQLRESRESFLGQLDVKDKQLELERAEHQKTRNLLHQVKMELKDMEIYYLTKEKESGQRRQREEETDQFKVKQEPGIEEEENQSKKKTASKTRKK